jgi:hypothetical protein
MISTIRQPTLTCMRLRPPRPQRKYVTHAKQRNALDFAEVVNGRASMYGVVFGGANWALTGLSVTQQIQYLPFQVLAFVSCGIVLASMNNANEKLTPVQFEDWATRDTGRAFMTIFALMTLFGLDSGPYYQ